jgi:stage V sporulation protein AD
MGVSVMANKRIGDQTINFSSQPMISGAYTVVGPYEGQGPLGQYFDAVLTDDMHGENTPEKAEKHYMEDASYGVLNKMNLKPEDIDIFLGGDLLNQIISATFTARALQVPYLGLYDACATFGENLAVGSMILEGDFADKILCAVSSNYLSAERQFRYPIELNMQRKGTAQWTVSGSGAAVLTKDMPGPRITQATIGHIVDYGIKDPNDLGCAMAPAAASTILKHFEDTGKGPGDYDLIFTGDLAACGSKMLHQLLKDEGHITLGNKHQDGGCLMFNPDQKAGAGGSGCACSATVFLGYILKEMQKGKYHRVLLVPTGALHSTLSCQQGESIPCIAHAVVVEA